MQSLTSIHDQLQRVADDGVCSIRDVKNHLLAVFERQLIESAENTENWQPNYETKLPRVSSIRGATSAASRNSTNLLSKPQSFLRPIHTSSNSIGGTSSTQTTSNNHPHSLPSTQDNLLPSSQLSVAEPADLTTLASDPIHLNPKPTPTKWESMIGAFEDKKRALTPPRSQNPLSRSLEIARSPQALLSRHHTDVDLPTAVTKPRTPTACVQPSTPKKPNIEISSLESKIKELENQNKKLMDQLNPLKDSGSSVIAASVQSVLDPPTNFLRSAKSDIITVESSSSSNTHNTHNLSHSACSTPVSCLPRHTPGTATRFRLPALQTEPLPDDQYEMTPWEDSDGHEGKSRAEREEEKRQRRQKKKIPVWCEDWVAISKSQTRIDPDSVFHSLKHFPKCELSIIFGDTEKLKKRKRGSSGNWGIDGLSDFEIRNYRNKMGQHLSQNVSHNHL